MVSSEVIYALISPVLGVLLVGYFAKVTPIAQDMLKDWKRSNEGILESCREISKSVDVSKVQK